MILVIKINPKYFRPTEVELLIGDYTKAKKELNWEPKVKFKDLVEIMVESDYNKQKTNLIKIKKFILLAI